MRNYPHMKITVETVVHAPIETVWNSWTQPEHITQWNAASPDWCCPSATNDVRVGGTFSSRMEARDGSAGFDFAGTYTEVVPQQKLVTAFGDRAAEVTFEEIEGGVKVTQTFDAEEENSAEMQRGGWQAILDSFKKHTESVV